MKKIIAIVLCIMTIATCSWHLVEQLTLLDIPSNKNDQYASFQKIEINKRTDIDICQKEILINQVDYNRNNAKRISQIATKTYLILIGLILFQLVLVVFILQISKKN